MHTGREKSDGLVHCSVKNAAVLCENNREIVTQSWASPSEEEEEKEEEEEEEEVEEEEVEEEEE